uniref:Uncharacterized protein n=1 Tax=Anguilla anguilla TaxID=7936 RepID=A0A0E9XVX7_ANGAN
MLITSSIMTDCSEQKSISLTDKRILKVTVGIFPCFLIRYSNYTVCFFFLGFVRCPVMIIWVSIPPESFSQQGSVYPEPGTLPFRVTQSNPV